MEQQNPMRMEGDGCIRGAGWGCKNRREGGCWRQCVESVEREDHNSTLDVLDVHVSENEVWSWYLQALTQFEVSSTFQPSNFDAKCNMQINGHIDFVWSGTPSLGIRWTRESDHDLTLS